MALKTFLLVLLVYSVSDAQRQGNNTSLPLTYNVTEIQGDETTCPTDQLRQETKQTIAGEIRTLLRDTVVPQLAIATNTTSLPQCPCLTGGGTRIAFLDMTNSSQQCPPNWLEITSPTRACGRTSDSACDSTFYPSNGISYRQVCGRIKAYQFCTPEAFYQIGVSDSSIDSRYVDGVSITHGSNPRQHVWTFAAAREEQYLVSTHACPCSDINNPNSATIQVPSFVGNDYFCDSGAPTPYPYSCSMFFADDPLWDAAGCGPTSTCCEFNNPPWFCKTLLQSTTDDIEVRICSAQSRSNEDTPIEQIEIYIS